MPLTGAERQKRYMERMKEENPDKYEIKKKKHLEYVKKKQKKIIDLTDEENSSKREKWHEWLYGTTNDTVKMPLTGAERQKRYMERMKDENPEKYETKKKKHLENVKKKQKKIIDLTDEKKFARGEKKQKEDNINKKEREEKVKIRRQFRAMARRFSLEKENKMLKVKLIDRNRKLACLRKKLNMYKERYHSLIKIIKKDIIMQ